MTAAAALATADPAAHVDAGRLLARLDALARHGARADGGVDRPALGEAEIAARAELVAWGRASGLEPATDALANLFLRLPGHTDTAPVLAGSHIDSQPTGGRFDGTVGVLAALAAVEAIQAAGIVPKRPIEVVAWMNEEACRFAPGMMGSEAFAGLKTADEILPITDAAGITVGEAAAAVLAADDDVPLRPLPGTAHAFVEAHIEQGTVLEQAGVPLGVVTGIQGTRRYRVRVTGEAAHAGTTARADRRDALMAAMRMIAAVEDLTREAADTLFTVGLFEVKPNAPSVIPAEAFFSIDIRQADDAVLDRLGTAIPETLAANAGPCAVEVRQIAHAPSVAFDEGLRRTLYDAAANLAAPAIDVFSAAGHDARSLARVCPTAMVFIPCRGGVSHHPSEHAEAEHIVLAARVLATTLARLADG
ncbi:M20 family metallo-hydrolase [Pseudoxanthobacter sp. M-2]|uniref:M20 family metallo-hydrolase n=1 Tax=Pseudoxanthobacter sp. M-2 TaxID=3078754 RepID=UPI0038FC4D54